MMSANFKDFLTQPFPHLELISTIKFMKPPLLHQFFHDPLPLRCRHHIWKPPNLFRGRGILALKFTAQYVHISLIIPLLLQVRGLHGEPAAELPRYGAGRRAAVVPLPAGRRPLPAGANHSERHAFAIR